MMSFKHFQYAFANDLDPAAQRAGWERDIVPESRVLSRGGLGKAAKIDFSRPHPPLLLIGSEQDHIMPAAVNRRNHRRYRNAASITDYREFPGRSHYSVIAGPRWQEVADYALDWAVRVTESVPAPAR